MNTSMIAYSKVLAGDRPRKRLAMIGRLRVHGNLLGTVVAGLFLLSASCGGMVDLQEASSASGTDHEPADGASDGFCQRTMEQDRGTHLVATHTLDDWFVYADHVVEVTVLDERVAERAFAPQEPPEFVHARDELLQVERVFSGSLVAGQTLWIRSHDFVVVDALGEPAEGQCQRSLLSDPPSDR